MRSAPDMVLFDLDGTLVDSAPDIAFCVDLMLRELGLPPAGEAEVRQWVGNGAERLIKRALTRDMDAEPQDGQLLRRALLRFLDFYAIHTDQHSRLYPGAREALAALKNRGAKLGLVTNKGARFTTPLLQSLGIADDFQIVVCGDTLPKRKPDPLPLLHCAEVLGAAPENSVMVGDSINDIEAARAANMRIICVSFGYNHGNDIREEKPDLVIHSLLELHQHL